MHCFIGVMVAMQSELVAYVFIVAGSHKEYAWHKNVTLSYTSVHT